jgi:hypothetical protein
LTKLSPHKGTQQSALKPTSFTRMSIKSIQELPADMIITICHQVFHENTKGSVLEKLKKTILKSIIDLKIKWDNEAIPSPFGVDFDKDIYEDEVENVIFNEIKNLSQKDKDTIICDYGMIKAIKQLHDFQKIGCGDSPQEICEYMEQSTGESMCNDMIELIIKGEVEFRHEWYNNNN